MKKPSRGPAWKKLALIAVVAMALGALWRFTPLAELAKPEHLRGMLDAVGGARWAPVLLAAAFTPAAFLMFPRPVLTLLTIVTLGVKLGLACSVAGILAAALATYGTGRVLKRDTVRKLAGDRFERATHVLRGHGVMAIFAANMLPVPPFGLQGIIAGAIRIKLWEYSLGTLLSLLPGALMLTAFGQQIRAALQNPSEVNYWLPAAAAAAFAIFVYFGRRWAAKRI